MKVYNYFRDHIDAVRYVKENGGIIKCLVTADGSVTSNGVQAIRRGMDIQDMHIFRYMVEIKIDD